MPRFFLDGITEDMVTIKGEGARHIARSLRMKAGEKIILCDGQGYDYNGRIYSVEPETVTVKIESKIKNITEPDIKVTLYQAVPKGDKMEQIIQKSVELGVAEIVPVLTSRCISRPDPKAIKKKIERYNKIAAEAAKQSGRGIIPVVKNMVTFSEAVERILRENSGILFYECGGKRLPELMDTVQKQISIIIGSEGGFEPSEVEYARCKGIRIGSLGKRILRCETAPLCALSIIMYYTQNV